jgi:hypothetical protein
MKVGTIIAPVSLVIIAGCASPVYVQTDESANLAKYKTFMWVDTRSSQDDSRNLTAFAKEGVQRAVNAELAEEGWTEVSSDPDVLLSYDILVERNTQQQSQAVYSQPFTRVYFNPWLRRWGTVYYPSRFIGYDTYQVPVKEGTITITMIDAETDKTVWQAWTTDEMTNMKFTSDDINKGVRNIFKKFDTGNRP